MCDKLSPSYINPAQMVREHDLGRAKPKVPVVKIIKRDEGFNAVAYNLKR